MDLWVDSFGGSVVDLSQDIWDKNHFRLAAEFMNENDVEFEQYSVNDRTGKLIRAVHTIMC